MPVASLTITSTPSSLQGQCRAGALVSTHTPSWVAPPVRRRQLNTRKAAPLAYVLLDAPPAGCDAAADATRASRCAWRRACSSTRPSPATRVECPSASACRRSNPTRRPLRRLPRAARAPAAARWPSHPPSVGLRGYEPRGRQSAELPLRVPLVVAPRVGQPSRACVWTHTHQPCTAPLEEAGRGHGGCLPLWTGRGVALVCSGDALGG